MSRCRLSTIYSRMKDRCYNPKNIRYHCYGGRGITVCEEWLTPYWGYKNFKKWALSNGYRDDLSIDRIDVNKGYSPDNCRWFTNKEQCNNKKEADGTIIRDGCYESYSLDDTGHLKCTDLNHGLLEWSEEDNSYYRKVYGHFWKVELLGIERVSYC